MSTFIKSTERKYKCCKTYFIEQGSPVNHANSIRNQTQGWLENSKGQGETSKALRFSHRLKKNTFIDFLVFVYNHAKQSLYKIACTGIRSTRFGVSKYMYIENECHASVF